MLDFQAARWLMEGELAGQVGNEHPTSVPTNRFETADGAVNIAVAGEVTWTRLAKALGREDWLADPAYEDNAGRREHRARLNDEIQAAVKGEATAALVDRLLAAGVPCGPIYRIDEMFEDPQVRHLKIAEEMDSEPFGPTRAMGQPVRLERTPSRIAARPPERGEHADEILKELGLAETEIADLRARAIV
jgi:formyl-CoA transferase